MRIARQLEEKIKSGELRDFILKKIGLDINKYPKIQDVLAGGRFTFAKPKAIVSEFKKQKNL